MRAVCDICPHHCALEEGRTGLCKARTNIKGSIKCTNYGKLTSLALDPIEKKPLSRFLPGSKILSAGSYGCNLRCPFCQNHCISMAGGEEDIETVFMSPEELVEKALELVARGNIGIAHTYNEPLVGYEYVTDCSRLAREKKLKNVLVTNGFICSRPLISLLPLIDAMNIDLKSFNMEFYRRIGGKLETVMQTIRLAAANCHVEITFLVIPDENDSADEIKAMSEWIAGIDPDIPLHISRFFPMYKYDQRKPTPVSKVYELADIAGESLRYVYTGNC